MLCTSNLLFYMNPREDTIVFNTRSNGEWMREEVISNTFFKERAEFTLVITALEDLYEVKINGTFMYGFKHCSSAQPQAVAINETPYSASIEIVE